MEKCLRYNMFDNCAGPLVGTAITAITPPPFGIPIQSEGILLRHGIIQQPLCDGRDSTFVRGSSRNGSGVPLF